MKEFEVLFHLPFSVCRSGLDLGYASISQAGKIEKSAKQRESGNNRQFFPYFLEDVFTF